MRRESVSFLRLNATIVLAMSAGACSRPGVGDRSDAEPAHLSTSADSNRAAGLPVRSWITTVDAPGLWAILQYYEPRDDQVLLESRRLWGANGLRVFAMPSASVADVEGDLRKGPSGASVERQDVLPNGEWTEIVRGPASATEWTLALDSSQIALGPGALRLLARSWIVPLPPDAGRASGPPVPGMRIEIVPQHAEPRVAPSATGEFGAPPTTLDPTAGGQIFERLLLSLTARGDIAYLIVPENPGVDWSGAGLVGTESEASASDGSDALSQATPSVEPGTPRVGQVVRGRPSSSNSGPIGDSRTFDPTIGPPRAGQDFTGTPTIGERMLMRRARTSDGAPGSRLVILLEPRVPERIMLTGE